MTIVQVLIYQLKMELSEPKKKHRARLEHKQSYPIIFDENGELIIFTAQLSSLGTCIAEPDDMTAIHSMGFFGKGSLSRSYPTFGKARYGAPPVIKERQWLQRLQWMREVKELSEEFQTENEMEKIINEDLQNQPGTSGVSGKTSKSSKAQNSKLSDVIEIVADKNTKLQPHGKRCLDNDIEILDENREPQAKHSKSIDEIILDSAEDEDIVEISKEEFNKKRQDPSQRDELNFSSEEENNDIDIRKVLILPDSDSENENYLNEIRPRIEDDGFPVKESLHLTFEESFFLVFALGCLRVMDFRGKILSIEELWDQFCRDDIYFIQKYVIYHYFRSKGWVVKPGLKFGGDFLLYKQGPPFYHASYIVLVDVIDETTLERIPEKAMRRMNLKDLIGMERLAESAAKEILLAQVMWPDSVPRENNLVALEKLSEFTVKEILMRRWRINKNSTTSSLVPSEDEEDSA